MDGFQRDSRAPKPPRAKQIPPPTHHPILAVLIFQLGLFCLPTDLAPSPLGRANTPFLNISMIVPNRDVATGEAAKLVLANLKGALACRTSANKQMAGAADPIVGIRRDAQTARCAGRRLLLGKMWSMRNSELYKVSYNKVKDLRYLACEDETDPPPPGSPGGRLLGNSIWTTDVNYPTGFHWRIPALSWDGVPPKPLHWPNPLQSRLPLLTTHWL